jgi:hypothetical protein
MQVVPPPESAPDLPAASVSFRRHSCLDRQGLIQAFAGIVIALIALLTSYDHIALWFIVASMALVLVDAQLATGSRLRAAQEAARAADETAQERDRAAEERERSARRARRQDRCALAQFDFQLNPNTPTRQRLADLISLRRDYGEFA